MTLPGLPVTTLGDDEIERINNNTIEPNKLVATRANLAAESIDSFLDALRANPYFSQNKNLIRFTNYVLQYSIALNKMQNQKQALEQIINNIRTSNPSFFAHQTPQGVVSNIIEINAPRML
jgi:hypothetical protein